MIINPWTVIRRASFLLKHGKIPFFFHSKNPLHSGIIQNQKPSCFAAGCLSLYTNILLVFKIAKEIYRI
jgi:hypothetical protein